MAKATLTFDLPEEQEAFLVASKGMSYLLSLIDLDDALRNWNKYGHDFDIDNIIDSVRDQLRDLMSSHGVSLEDVT